MKFGTETSNTGTISFAGRLAILIPVFILAVWLGFLLELITVEKFGLNSIPQSRAHFAYRIHLIKEQWQIIAFPQSVNSESAPTSTNHPTTIKKHSGESLSDNSSLILTPGKDNLLNLSSFKWIRNNVSICRKENPNELIIPVLVHTARYHFQERSSIRKSWGSIPLYKNWSVRLVFLLGEADRGADPSKNVNQFENQEKQLDKEESTFGDIVTGNFLDSYKNLTYKHMMGYKWILDFCQNADLVLKIDDDMFIDIIQFLDWRSADLVAQKNKTIPDLYCNTFMNTQPQRCKGCKWYTSEGEWAPNSYPAYCSGWAYGITVNLMKKLYSLTKQVKFFWVDDVYATGILMEELKKDKNFTLNVTHLWGHVRGIDFKTFRPLCEKKDFSMKRIFGAVVPISRGANFEGDMSCLWNKTLHDLNLNLVTSHS